MIKNYFKIALRNLWRNKVFSAINIFGLAIGIATCLIIMLFVQNELSYDRFNKKADQIVRVVFRGTVDGQEIKEANVMPPVAQTLTTNYPEVLQATRLVNGGSPVITYGDKSFKKDAIAYFDTNFYDTVQSHKYVLLNKIRSIPEVAMASLATSPPSSNNSWSGTLKYKDGKKEVSTDVQQRYGDTNYVKLYGIKLLAGSNIQQTDTVTSFLINETYAHILGFQKPQQAVGKYLDWRSKQVPVRGVVSDFNQQSLHETIKPLVIGSWSNSQRQISIALVPQNESGTAWKAAISKIEKAFKEVYPKDDFDYKFVDQEIAKYYDEERHISSLLMWATGLAVFISCLGLLGLVLYTTTQRTKEIEVRKVLGASVSQIVTMISKDFLLLTIIAFLIATPLAWIGMRKWLQNFAYRTDISWWIFLLGAIVMIIIALITLGFQTIKAAMANPVKSLRSE